MKTIRELTDIELNEVAGGIGVIAIGNIGPQTHNQATVGVNAPALSAAGGGVGNSNTAVANESAWIANLL